MARVPMSRTREVYPVDKPQTRIAGELPSSRAQVLQFGKALGDDGQTDASSPEAGAVSEGVAFLTKLATHGGDLTDILSEGVIDTIGTAAEREWRLDQGSRQDWFDIAEKGLKLAAQDHVISGSDGDYGPWEGASDIHYPILTQAALEFDARAYPEIVKGDKVIGVKMFFPPNQQPAPAEIARDGPQPQTPQDAQASQQAMQQAQQQEAQGDLAMKARQSRAERVQHYMNWLVFYKMENWEGETDLLLLESAITGVGYKKTFKTDRGVQTDYVSAMKLTVSNDTKSLFRCPRLTQEFDIYPYEIEEGRRSGRYRDIDLPSTEGNDPEAARGWIEQHRMEDLDGDGLSEPYIVTVDVETKRTMRIEAAYTPDDIVLNPQTGRVVRIDRWQPFSAFIFLMDPRGAWHGLGLARLLDAITDSVDTTLNQLVDAGNAQIAGGGFIGSNVRLQGSGQGGVLYFQPGEFQVVATQGQELQNAIWERTVPSPSPVAFQMLEFLLSAAKDLASVKDVISGDAPSTAPVGTTLALQNQALQVFSSIYKRMYRGFKEEFQIMYRCLKRWATEEEKREYAELTGGDFDADFSGDGTDIQPVADPTVVTKMQKVARIQTLIQLAESPVGMAAGMQQPGPAQALISDALDVLDIDRPERFVAPVPPNPELLAKVQEMAAAAALKNAEAKHVGAKITTDNAAANLDNAKAVKEMGEVAAQTHGFHQEAARIAQQGILPIPEGNSDGAGNTQT